MILNELSYLLNEMFVYATNRETTKQTIYLFLLLLKQPLYEKIALNETISKINEYLTYLYSARYTSICSKHLECFSTLQLITQF